MIKKKLWLYSRFLKNILYLLVCNRMCFKVFSIRNVFATHLGLSPSNIIKLILNKYLITKCEESSINQRYNAVEKHQNLFLSCKIIAQFLSLSTLETKKRNLKIFYFDLDFVNIDTNWSDFWDKFSVSKYRTILHIVYIFYFEFYYLTNRYSRSNN